MTVGLPAPLSGLLQPRAYAHAVRDIQLVETHISWVLLTGDIAYKIKKPVSFDFLDLRSEERRAFFCAEELRLNRRFAPELYLGVSTVTMTDGQISMDGLGVAIERAVRMRQFDRSQELDRLLAGPGVEPGELEHFGQYLALTHNRLPAVATEREWGQASTVAAILRENFRQCLRACQAAGTDSRLQALQAPFEALLDGAHDALVERGRAGCVRECHGDLHTRNVVRYRGRLIAFDSLEFEPAFRWIDVADDLSFLWMDLDAQGGAAEAADLLGGYFTAGGDYHAARVLRLYAAHRALVRAKVTALDLVREAGSEAQAPARSLHQAYLGAATRQLTSSPPRLLLMHGLSGSGKSWLAARLARRSGALHIRSDVERKRLVGLPASANTHSALGENLYSEDASRRVYERLAACADDALAGGFTAIVDATFHRREERARFIALAQQHGLRPQLIHCQAPDQVLQQRIAGRLQDASDASEADLAVLRWQQAQLEPVAAAEGIEVIAVDTTRADAVEQVPTGPNSAG